MSYQDKYAPYLLVPILRKKEREKIGLSDDKVIFSGKDIWHCYDLSFLGKNGKPYSGILYLEYDSDSVYLIESKSLKLYLNSFNMTRFEHIDHVKLVIEKDLQSVLNTQSIKINIVSSDQFNQQFNNNQTFYNLDNLGNINDFAYQKDKHILQRKTAQQSAKSQIFYSHLLKTNCPMTGQPDFASIYIYYKPYKYAILEDSLLYYIVSFREKQEFHELCCEEIITDLAEILQPQELVVCCKYNRRGGIDITPVRIYPKNKATSIIKNDWISYLICTREFRQ